MKGKRIENAKVALLQFPISEPHTDMESNVQVKDFSQMDSLFRDQRKYVAGMVKKIKASGVNVLLLQKSILRDAISSLAASYLEKVNIAYVRDVEREDVEFLSKTLGLVPVAHIDQLTPDKLGTCALCDEVPTSRSKLIRFTGIATEAKTISILLRGTNELVLSEAERSLHDALCVLRCLVKKPFVLPGGGAPEMEVACQLQLAASKGWGAAVIHDHYAQALESIPYILAESAGLTPTDIVAQLRSAHANGEVNAGINLRKSQVQDMMGQSVIQPSLVTTSALTLSTEFVRMILKIDGIVPTR